MTPARTISLLLLTACAAFGQAGLRSPAFYSVLHPLSSGGPPVGGYVMWLSAQTTNTLYTNASGTVFCPFGGFAGKWQDQSSQITNNIYQDSISGRPWYTNSPSGWNSKNTLLFGSINPLLQHNTGLSSSNGLKFGMASSDSVTVFVVGSLEAGSADTYKTIWGWGGGSGGDFRMRQSSSLNAIEFTDGVGFTSALTVLTNKAYCITLRWDNTANTCEVWTNLVVGLSQSGMTAALPTGVFSVGHVPGFASDQCWNGYVAEMIVYPSYLSNTDTTNVITYLKNLYSL